MSHAYTPGLQVKPQILYRVRRSLPITGEVLVQLNEMVSAQQVIARTDQPGDVFPINLTNSLGIPASEVPGAMQLGEGAIVSKGDKLAQSKGIFGFFKQDFLSPVSGSIESISNVTGQVILRGQAIPVEMNAFVAGKVVEVIPSEGAVIETSAAFIQGIFGIGGESFGPLNVLTNTAQEDLLPQMISEEQRGAIIVAGRRIHGDAFSKARACGVAAIIAGGIDDQDLKEILGYDLGVAITGSEDLGITVIITEGFGEIAMATATFDLLKSHQGHGTSVNGATQIRAGVMRPEIVIPIHEQLRSAETAQKVGGGVLDIGSHVRLIRDPYFGKLGTVFKLPPEPQVLASGSKARVLEVDCETGERVVVPRANVEIVGD